MPNRIKKVDNQKNNNKSTNTNNSKKYQYRRNMNNNRQPIEKPYLPENERLPLVKLVHDFIQSGESELVLPGLSNVHRKYLHHYARVLNLHTKSFGSQNSRILHITQKKRTIAYGVKRKLELTPATKKLLSEMAPTIKEQIHKQNSTNNRYSNAQHNNGRLRGEAMFLNLGPRLVPPRANRIDFDRYREKLELPINRYQDEIHKLLSQHSIIIINGETGSGKTTQVPQFILNEAHRRNRPCRIIVTQPRRVAAVSVAHRVAEERGEAISDTVGYQIRMESRVRKTTNLIYTTSGCFLRSLMANATELFRKITHLIIDEIHERDKYTDFTLISIKEQLKHNKDFKVILMSATMDINLLSKYFDNCPVLRVPGQIYDVKIFYLEDILYYTGYRTALMEKYLRSMTQMAEEQQQLHQQNFEPMVNTDDYSNPISPVESMESYLDNILDQCCDPDKSTEELCELFDHLQYCIECEGMYVDSAHTQTGITPLMAACKCNLPHYVEFFVKQQANVLLKDVDGYTAIEYAASFADGACTQILESNEFHLQQHMLFSEEDIEKTQLLSAYQKQINTENEVDHDLILSLIEGLYRSEHPGAIMVFLPGYNDIVQQRDLINSTLPAGTYRICILHGQMDSRDQIEALQRHSQRKILLSTNIGQTSITVPDLAFIIDSGKVKMKTYDSITESSQLQSVWISKADANQRSGRAGRTQNGICYRLYSKAKYEFMPQFCIPEFMRIPLAEICLYAKTIEKDTDVQTYLSRALNPPSKICIQNAIKKLKILQVFNDDESVTDLGKQLVEIPLDVQLGICLLYAVFFKCVDPVLTIVAFHSIKDPFILPTDRSAQGQASYQRKSFSGKSFSDQNGILGLYKAYIAVRGNRKRCNEFCNKYFLSQSAMEMFCATRRQIAELLSYKYRLGHQATLFNDDWNMVQYCLAAGFYPNIAVVDRYKNVLSSATEKHLIVQRTSALNPPGIKNLKDFVHQLPHDWVIFFEKSRVGRTCSINMNTVVSPVIIALQCGRHCIIDDGSIENTEIAEDDAVKAIAKEVQELAITKKEKKTIMILDNWINFEMVDADAKNLKTLRSLIESQFLAFLRQDLSQQGLTSPFCVQKLLYTLEAYTLS